LANAAARKLRAAGYRVSVLGVGSAKGAPVPLAEGGFLKDDQGAILLPKLDQGALSALAEQGGGRYVSAGLDDRDIEMLMPPPAAELTQQTQKQDTQADQWREEGPWLLVLLLPLAALAFRRGWLAPLVLVAALTPLPEAHAFGWDDLWLNPDQQAQRLMQAGQSQAAAETFQRPDWRAAAHYEAGDYQQALDALEGLQDRRADYNRGNALAHVGQLEQALAAYEQALEKDPEDQDARHNRDLVKKLLDQKQQQEQEDQQQQQGQQGQKDQQDQQGQQGQEDQQQQQGQQGQEDQQQQQGQQGQEDQQDQQGQQEQEDQQDQQGQQGQEDQQDQQGQENQQDQENQQAGREPEEASSDEATPRNQDAQPEQSRQASSEDAEAPSSQSPDIDDLLGREPGSASPVQSADAEVDAEDRQAMEQMLRRVEDDPAGLLRQRFLLQHLRRNGQLP
jgi:Ca-activated chloride channel family protein